MAFFKKLIAKTVEEDRSSPKKDTVPKPTTKIKVDDTDQTDMDKTIELWASELGIDGPYVLNENADYKVDEEIKEKREKKDKKDQKKRGLMSHMNQPVVNSPALERRMNSPSPEPLRAEADTTIDVIMAVLVSATKKQQISVDSIGQKYLVPMKTRVAKDTVTLAEKSRYFRLDRLTEILEGIIWLQKKLIKWGDHAGDELNRTQKRELVKHVSVIKQEGEEIRKKWQTDKLNRQSLRFQSGAQLEKDIYLLHRSVEKTLLEMRNIIWVWTIANRRKLGTDKDTRPIMEKVEVLLASLPPNYLLGDDGGSSAAEPKKEKPKKSTKGDA